ncbi:erythromycin esterase family protein [Kribbella amoyensis]|nr:erythromycin esterase family protein [Kribbella amoyensis]
MSAFVGAGCELLGFGEPTHQEPAFGWVRNEVFAGLVETGFSSIALETDRVAALLVDDFVRTGIGDLDAVMRDGFSHTFGELETNRALVRWLREYNAGVPVERRVGFHGFDAATEMMSAPSPRRYLEFGRDYLGLELDVAGLAGPDERWSCTEAIMDPASSPGDSAEADRLRVIADDLLTVLYTRAPELIAKTSRADWYRAETHLTTGLGLLRYHKQSAERLEQQERISRLSSVRDALMAQNLLDIRRVEAGRGGTLVFANNLHLQRNTSAWRLGGMDYTWSSAGSIVARLVGRQYAFVAGSLGRSEAVGLGEPAPDTYESFLQSRTTSWGLIPAKDVPPARTRTETTPEQGYFPLDQATVDGADAILHISAGA